MAEIIQLRERPPQKKPMFNGAWPKPPKRKRPYVLGGIMAVGTALYITGVASNNSTEILLGLPAFLVGGSLMYRYEQQILSVPRAALQATLRKIHISRSGLKLVKRE